MSDQYYSLTVKLSNFSVFFINNILIYTIFYIPIILLFLLFIIPKKNIILIRDVSLIGTFYIFILTIFIMVLYNISSFTTNTSIFQFHYVSDTIYYLFNIKYVLGVDGISILLNVLTALLIPLCILVNINTIKYRLKEFIILLVILEILLLNTFSVLNIIFFYIFFEAILIPMFIMIGIWGSRERKIHAAYQFFLFTFLGSIFMLLALLIIYIETGSLNLEVLLNYNFSNDLQLLLWILMFISFAVKIPMMPVHIWLPEAHVEAPTAGSVLLAGVLLKLGSYGMLRFMLPLFPYGNYYFLPLVYTLAIIAIIYGSLTTLRQVDLKKIIAYSSVVHMNFALLGLFALNIEGLQGAFYLMLSHGIVSSGLFLCVGVLYDRYHTRLLKYYSGIVIVMPLYTIVFLILTLANIGFPGTSSFVGEFLVFLGIFQSNSVIGFLGTFSVVLSAAYGIWLFNRVSFRNLKYLNFFKYKDLTLNERFIFFPLILLCIFMGIYPKFFLDLTFIPFENIIYYN